MSSSDTSGAVAERLLKLAIALVVLILILGPVLALSLHIAGPRLTDFLSRHILGALHKSGDHDGITAGPEAYALGDLEDRLTGLSAYRGEAKGAASTLQILLVRHTRPAQGGAGTAAFRSLKLDLSGAAETATVVIADRPLLLELTGQPPVRRAMLGVEGVAPFDLKNAPQGLLAGFRIAAFGASSVARPEQFVEGRDARIFCGSIKSWRAFYGVSPGSVSVWVATNPTAVAVTDKGVSDDGDAQGDLPDLAAFCKGY
jgi:hypothetical protein